MPELRSASWSSSGEIAVTVTRRYPPASPSARGARRLLRGEAAAGLLHGRQRLLDLRQRPGADVDARGLGRDRDLLAGRRVAARARLGRRLDAYVELHQGADADLLRVPDLLEDDLFE